MKWGKALVVQLKTNPEHIILNGINQKSDRAAYLVSGNEETLIKKIVSVLVANLKKNGFSHIENNDDKIIAKDKINPLESELFSDKKIIIYNNPKTVDLDFLNSDFYSDIAVIIFHNKLNNSSKIKKDFDSHKVYVSISCYQITIDIKKKIFNYLMLDSKIKINEAAFWFFLANSPNEYQLFENEVNKIKDYDKNIDTPEEISLIISGSEDKNIEELFFLLSKSYKEILIGSQKKIKTSQDCFVLIQRIKFFFDLILFSNNINDALLNFPRYLFKEKKNFEIIYSKSNKTKILHIHKMIKKSEILIRKYSSMHLSISQRFLMNIKKTLN